LLKSLLIDISDHFFSGIHVTIVLAGIIGITCYGSFILLFQLPKDIAITISLYVAIGSAVKIILTPLPHMILDAVLNKLPSPH